MTSLVSVLVFICDDTFEWQSTFSVSEVPEEVPVPEVSFQRLTWQSGEPSQGCAQITAASSTTSSSYCYCYYYCSPAPAPAPSPPPTIIMIIIIYYYYYYYYYYYLLLLTTTYYY